MKFWIQSCIMFFKDLLFKRQSDLGERKKERDPFIYWLTPELSIISTSGLG